MAQRVWSNAQLSNCALHYNKILLFDVVVRVAILSIIPLFTLRASTMAATRDHVIMTSLWQPRIATRCNVITVHKYPVTMIYILGWIYLLCVDCGPHTRGIFNYAIGHGRRHGGSRVGKRPPWKKSGWAGWAWPTLEILAVVWKLPGNSLSMKV